MRIVTMTALAFALGLIASPGFAGPTTVIDPTAPPELTAKSAPLDAYQEPRRRTAPQYEPALPGQFRAPKPPSRIPIKVEVLTNQLTWPWAVVQMPDGRLLVTEKYGTLRIVDQGGRILPPIAGRPAINPADANMFKGGGGLLDVILAPDFLRSNRIYLTFSEAAPGPSGTEARLAVGTGVLSPDRTALVGFKVVWRMDGTSPSHEHFGSRLAFDREGALFVTTGERAADHSGGEGMLVPRRDAQNPFNDMGKLIRIMPDGSIPRDNPFADGKRGKPEVYALGFRNSLGLGVQPSTGLVWTVEHGPTGGDELNQPEPGKNYGWPTISYGRDHDNSPIEGGFTQKDGLEQPVYYWDPNPAPGAMIFYKGGLFPAWNGDILVAGLGSMRLHRLVLDGRHVAYEDWYPLKARVRDVTEAADGSLYIVTDEAKGQLLHITPVAR